MGEAGFFGMFILGTYIIDDIHHGHRRTFVCMHQNAQAVFQSKSVKMNHDAKVGRKPAFDKLWLLMNLFNPFS
jgi:hypothetical protein